MRKYLEEISPLFAGIAVVTSLFGLYDFGELANKIVSNWEYYSRIFWNGILPLFNISINEKEQDALTTLAFFLPMAISSFISWRIITNTNENGKTGDISVNHAERELRTKIYAAFFGAIFMVIVGNSVINDVIAFVQVYKTMPEEIRNEKAVYIYLWFFTSHGNTQLETMVKTFIAHNKVIIYYFGCGVIFVASLYLYFLKRFEAIIRNEDSSNRNIIRGMGITSGDKWIKEIFEKHLLMEKIQKVGTQKSLIIISTIRIILTVIIGMIGLLLVIVASFLTFPEVTSFFVLLIESIGFIRPISPLLVLVAFCTTVFLNPKRMLKTAGVVIIIVIASYAWDALTWVHQMLPNQIS